MVHVVEGWALIILNADVRNGLSKALRAHTNWPVWDAMQTLWCVQMAGCKRHGRIKKGGEHYSPHQLRKRSRFGTLIWPSAPNLLYCRIM
jgi:hypothetical protein